MRKKTLGTTLIAVGAFLIVVSALGLFLILIDGLSHKYFVMASSSMEPAISKGEVSKVKLGVNIYEVYAAPKDVYPSGDIIAFRKPTDPDVILIHRAVGSGTDTSYYLITQGDANAGQDGWRVREENLVGKVVEIYPHFWAYNHIFMGMIFSIGVVILLSGVVIRQRKRAELYRAYDAVKPAAAAKPVIVEPKPKRKFFCRYCGTENKLDASYCEVCGKKL